MSVCSQLCADTDDAEYPVTANATLFHVVKAGLGAGDAFGMGCQQHSPFQMGTNWHFGNFGKNTPPDATCEFEPIP
jgi:hypothetical protein